MLKQRPTLDSTRSNQYQVPAQVDKVKSHLIQSARDNIAELYDLHRFESNTEPLDFIDSHLADNKYLFPLAERVEGGVYGLIQYRECRKLLTNSQGPLCFLAEAIPWFVYIKFYHRANNCGKYADGFHNSMIDDKDGHLPSPLIMFTCAALRHVLLEWQTNKDVHPKGSKSKLIAD